MTQPKREQKRTGVIVSDPAREAATDAMPIPGRFHALLEEVFDLKWCCEHGYDIAHVGPRLLARIGAALDEAKAAKLDQKEAA